MLAGKFDHSTHGLPYTLDLHQLRTFVAIAREGNLTRASERLFLSQPAASSHMRLLESELDIRLFVRTARGMELTPAGKSLLIEAEKTLDAARVLQAQASALRQLPLDELRLGIVSEPSILRLGELFTLLVRAHPTLRVSVTQGISGEITDRILEKTLDVGYVIGPVSHPSLSSQEVAKVSLRIVAPSEWADRIAGVGWDAIASLPWISTPAKCSFRQIAAKMFSDNGANPKISLEADQELTLQKLVSSGLGLTLLREDVALAAQAQGDLVLWDGHVEWASLNIVYNRIEEKTAALDLFLEVIQRVWNPPEVSD